MPFIFNSLPEAICIFKISWGGVNLSRRWGVGVTSAGALVRGAFIAILAYTYRLTLSRDKLSFADPEALSPNYAEPLGNRRLPKAGSGWRRGIRLRDEFLFATPLRGCCYFFIAAHLGSAISTRRFLALPSSVLLSAMGTVLP